MVAHGQALSTKPLQLSVLSVRISVRVSFSCSISPHYNNPIQLNMAQKDRPSQMSHTIHVENAEEFNMKPDVEVGEAQSNDRSLTLQSYEKSIVRKVCYGTHFYLNTHTDTWFSE